MSATSIRSCLLAACLFLPVATVPARAQPLLELQEIASGLDSPLGLTHAGDGSGRLFIPEQTGRVRIHDGTALLSTPFLDLSSQVSCCGERGLLGLVFHPGYSDNGLFFVNYTATNGDTVVARFSVSADPDRADASSETEILRFSQPFTNHNGGHLAFGPDGFLYIGTGDGGSGGDPQNNGQNLDTFLGKLLRVDVDSAEPYAIPASNPFVGEAGALGEIWAYGLRNPWRFAFDRATGDIILADVGQDRFEEIDFQPAASGGGENYGWRLKEAGACFEPPSGCEGEGLVDPVLQYGRADGCSVTGGYRYRGPSQPTLSRRYVYGDFCSGTIWGGRPNSAGVWRTRRLLATGLSISSFGEDEAGRLYVVDLSGAVHRLNGLPLFASGFESGSASDWTKQRGDVEVVSPGLGGSDFALSVPVGTGRKSFVESRQPRNESAFEACFSLNGNRVDLGGGEPEIFRLRGGKTHVRLTLRERRKGYRVVLWARDDGDDFFEAGSARLRASKSARICVDWSRATSNRAADGDVRLLKNGKVQAQAFDLDNRRWRVARVQLGLPAAVDAGNGAFLIDDYTSSP